MHSGQRAMASMIDAERVLEPLLLAFHEQIKVTNAEFGEAMRRAQTLRTALAREFEAPVYLCGSIEHGDALTPLDDVDLGVIVEGSLALAERTKSPTQLMNRASRAIESLLGGEFPDITTSFADQKRSVVVRFHPTHSGKRDFTADVIVALDYREGTGILVPNLNDQTWDRSDPIRHNEMIREANVATNQVLNMVVRIAKTWNRGRRKPLSSWNIKALALECITRPVSLTEGVYTLFHHAAASLTIGPTRDPAGVAAPIRFEIPRPQVLDHLRGACDALDEIRARASASDLIGVKNLIRIFLNLD